MWYKAGETMPTQLDAAGEAAVAGISWGREIDGQRPSVALVTAQADSSVVCTTRNFSYSTLY